jgi:hypothetical protein
MNAEQKVMGLTFEHLSQPFLGFWLGIVHLTLNVIPFSILGLTVWFQPWCPWNHLPPNI